MINTKGQKIIWSLLLILCFIITYMGYKSYHINSFKHTLNALSLKNIDYIYINVLNSNMCTLYLKEDAQISDFLKLVQSMQINNYKKELEGYNFQKIILCTFVLKDSKDFTISILKHHLHIYVTVVEIHNNKTYIVSEQQGQKVIDYILGFGY